MSRLNAKNINRIDVWPNSVVADASNDSNNPTVSKKLGRMTVWPNSALARANASISSANGNSFTRASFFDGNTYLEVAANGVSPVFPATSRYGFLAYWYNASAAIDLSVILAVVDSIGKINVFVAHQVVNDQPVLQVTLSDTTALNWGDIIGSTELPIDNSWHNVIMFWDTTAQSFVYKVDGIVGVVALSKWIGSPFEVSYTDNTVRVAANDHHKTFAFHTGALAELFFEVGTERVLDDVIDDFIDNQGFPRYLSSNGIVPFGAPPQVYLWGKPNLMPLNLTDYSLFPLILTVPDGRGNEFSVTGTLQEAVSDPFNAPPASVGV